MMSIEIKNIEKSFKNQQNKKVKVLKGVNITFEENKIYGLLGRNGAGKSTLLNIVSNRLFPDSGTITINHEDSVENYLAQKQIFITSEADMYPDNFRVIDMFKWTDKFYPSFNMDKALKMSEKFGLQSEKKLKSLSTGYKTIAKQITALANNVPYVLLDEPVLGLDANHRELFYKLIIEEYAENPRTFVIATHLIEEVAPILEEVVIIEDGEIIENSSLENLMQMGYTVTGKSELIDKFTENKNVIGYDVIGAVKVAYILGNDNISSLPDGIEITGLNLQKLFIVLTGSKEEQI